MESTNPGSSSSSLKGSGDGLVHLKVLVPSIAAGAIIGKGGETIADIQKQAGGKIKMSKANDFYPGTNERVCLVTGPLESVSRILDFLLEKIREKPDPSAKTAIDFDNKISAQREKQVKVLIPNSTAGMIIGKGGSFIKQLKDESGAFIQISQKSQDTALQERVVTVIGEPESNKKAMTMILDKIMEDPQSGSCLNISYSDVQGLVANFNPTGSPFALNGTGSDAQTSPRRHQNGVHSPQSSISVVSSAHTNSTATSNGGGGGGGGATPSPFVLPLHGGGSLQLKFNMNPNRAPTDPALMSQYLDHIKAALQTSGYGDLAIEDIAQSISCLAHHGILVVNLVTQGSAKATTGAGQQASPGVHFPAPPVPLNEFISRAGTNFPRPPPAGPNAAAAAVHQPLVAASEPGGSHLSGFGYGSSSVHNHPGFTAAARYWGSNGSASDSPLAPHHIVAQPVSMDPSAVAAAAQQPLPEPFRGPATSPFSQSKYQGNKNSFGLATGPPPPPPGANGQHMEEQMDQVDLEINESIIGAVIGPQGKCIVDIQQFSGARIQISKKGTYSPGTRNRIVNVQGSTKSINAAKYLIEKKIVEEEGKRERNSATNSNGNNSAATNYWDGVVRNEIILFA